MRTPCRPPDRPRARSPHPSPPPPPLPAQLEKLLDLGSAEVVELLPARIRRRFSRGITSKHTTLLKKLRKAKKEVKSLEKPKCIKTHLRNTPILPECVGSVVGIYTGKVFNTVEIRPEMIGKYLAEFAITYKPTVSGGGGVLWGPTGGCGMGGCCACGGCSLGGGLACAAAPHPPPPPSPSPAAARPAWVGGDALLAVHPAQVRGVKGGGVALER